MRYAKYAVVAALACLLSGKVGQAATITTLASFGPYDGQALYGDVTVVGSTLYGTTSGYPGYPAGSVFSVPVAGGPVTTLASFTGLNGSNPRGNLLLIGNTLYGTTTSGTGANSEGTVFSIPAAGGPITTLASFPSGGINGYAPTAGLTLIGSNLYGTSAWGGYYSYGTVFSVNVGGGPVNDLDWFTNYANGANPLGSLVHVGTTLYGTTSSGGANGVGTIFKISTVQQSIITMATFNTANGANPQGDLLVVGNTLYGTTELGGAFGAGTVFSIPLAGGPVTTLASFDGSNGAQPVGGLLLIGDTLYGTTASGGATFIPAYGTLGTVFSIPLAGGPITTLASFDGAPDGLTPLGDLTTDGLGNLFGTTKFGGDVGSVSTGGTVFEITGIVPEPTTLGILTLGAVSLLARRRRR